LFTINSTPNQLPRIISLNFPQITMSFATCALLTARRPFTLSHCIWQGSNLQPYDPKSHTPIDYALDELEVIYRTAIDTDTPPAAFGLKD